MDSRDLQGLMEAYTKICAPVDEAVYGGEPKKPEAPKDDRMVVTAADKKGNTPAYQKFKAGHKGYKAADHLGEESVDEAVKGASPHAMEMRKGDAADRRKGIKPLSAKKGEEYAKYKMSQMAHSERKRMGEEVEQVDELYKGKHGQSETEYQDSRSPGGKMVSGTSKLSGAAYSYRGVKNSGPNPAGGSEKPKAQGRMTPGQRTELQYRKANLMKKEELDIFDAILEYLVAEGYAATNKEALVIMANMSEEWRTEIIESQYARENPEKYEREQAKKTSKKEKAMNDPHTGINSPAFAEFMRKQMGR